MMTLEKVIEEAEKDQRAHQSRAKEAAMRGHTPLAEYHKGVAMGYRFMLDKLKKIKEIE